MRKVDERAALCRSSSEFLLSTHLFAPLRKRRPLRPFTRRSSQRSCALEAANLTMAKTLRKTFARTRIQRLIAQVCLVVALGVCSTAINLLRERERERPYLSDARDSNTARVPPRYETLQKSTDYGPNGGLKEFGNVHKVRCGDNSAMTGFAFDYDDGRDQMRVRYACIHAAGDDGSTFGTGLERETAHGPSGGKLVDRNSMTALADHGIDCDESFVAEWLVRQWSRSASVAYRCTTGRTPSPEDCQSSTSAVVDNRGRKVSDFTQADVRCAFGEALTRFQYIDKRFSFTCCPRPALPETLR